MHSKALIYLDDVLSEEAHMIEMFVTTLKYRVNMSIPKIRMEISKAAWSTVLKPVITREKSLGKTLMCNVTCLIEKFYEGL